MDVTLAMRKQQKSVLRVPAMEYTRSDARGLLSGKNAVTSLKFAARHAHSLYIRLAVRGDDDARARQTARAVLRALVPAPNVPMHRRSRAGGGYRRGVA